MEKWLQQLGQMNKDKTDKNEKLSGVKILEYKEYVGKPLKDVLPLVAKSFGKSLKVFNSKNKWPSRYFNDILSGQDSTISKDEVPEEIKDGNFYYCLNSNILALDGRDHQAWINYDNGSFHQSSRTLRTFSTGESEIWKENDRILIVSNS
jgi:hypothetical protein